MLLLVNHGHPTHLRYRCAELGRLVQPRHSHGGIRETAAAGIPWAADNDAFGGWDAERERLFRQMLRVLEGLSGCLFVTAPDVVGDGPSTLKLWTSWRRRILDRGLPPALVLQDGMTVANTPLDAAAVFVGGSTDYKLGPDAAAIVKAAKEQGLHAHMGRVNSRQRTLYAKAIGCDSVDGTQTSMFPDRWIPEALEWVREPSPASPSWQLQL